MRRFAGWTCILALLSGTQKASGGEAGAERLVELEWVSLFDTPSFAPGGSPSVQFVPLSGEGERVIPFANATGKLAFRLADGKVRLDTNGDGSIGDTDAPAVGNGQIVKVSLSFGGRTVDYPLRVQIVEARYVLLYGGLALQGEIDGRTLRLFDGGLDGRFGEAGKDLLSVASSRKQSGNLLARGDGDLPMGRYAALGETLYELELLEAERKLRCRPHAGEAAAVSLKTDPRVKMVRVQLAHVDGLQFAALDGADPVRLVPGEYRFAQTIVGLLPQGQAAAPPKTSLLERLFGGGSAGPTLLMLSGYGEDAPAVTIRPGPQTLAPGPPFTLGFAAGRWGAAKEQVRIDAVWLAGGAGERYRADVSGPDVESALTCHVRAGGETQELRKLEFG